MISAPQLPVGFSITNAKLPQTYEAAKVALANCARIDECVNWASKADALASYAKQMRDETLLKYSRRIKLRALSRAGELLKTFEAKGKRTDLEPTTGTGGKWSQRDVAKASGLSERQQITAVRVANVDSEAFEAQIESDDPPTVTDLAAQGTVPRTVPPGFQQATALLGTLKLFAEFCRDNDPVVVAQGLRAWESAKVRQNVGIIDAWLDRLVVNLPAEEEEEVA